ncbi:MAG: hypothetical protein GWN86_21595 [Desulfobacterales bacterium]|nr:hypothetical protein [Desulfobacterales bacterium]
MRLRIQRILISGRVEGKIWSKHGVRAEEVRQAFEYRGSYAEAGGRSGIYNCYGGTFGGRFLFAVMRDLGEGAFKLITCFEMEEKHQKRYQQLKRYGGVNG